MILLEHIEIFIMLFTLTAVIHTAYKHTQDIYSLQGFLKATSTPHI